MLFIIHKFKTRKHLAKWILAITEHTVTHVSPGSQGLKQYRIEVRRKICTVCNIHVLVRFCAYFNDVIHVLASLHKCIVVVTIDRE